MMSVEGCLPALQSAASFHAARIVRHLGLPAADRDDINQDLLVEMIVRLRRFDPDRAAFATFIDLVAGHGACTIVSRYRSERRLFGAEPASIDDPKWAGLRETVSNDGGLSSLLGGSSDPQGSLDLAHDVTRTIKVLPDALRELCALLQSEPAAVALCRSGLGRATFYRRVREIRLRFLVEGVQAPA